MIRCAKNSSYMNQIPSKWKKSRIKDVALLIRAGGSLGLTKIKDYQQTGYPAYSAAGQDGFVNVVEFSQPGVVLSAIGARCGKCFYATSNWTTLANTQAILADESQVSNRFLWYLINDENFWHRSGTAQPFIKPSDVQNAWIPVPPPQEQSKIIWYLDSLLHSIQKHKNALQEIQNMRQGLLQKLRDGELFSIDLKKRLQDVATLRMGEILIAKNLTGDGIPVFSADTGSEPWGFTSNAKHVFERGTIILSARGSIGFPRLPNYDKFISTQTTIAVRPNPKMMLPEFLFVWLQSIDYDKIKSVQAVPMMTVTDMNEIWVPKIDVEIQSNIAGLFESLTKIEGKHVESIEVLKDIFAGCRFDLLYGKIAVSDIQRDFVFFS